MFLAPLRSLLINPINLPAQSPTADWHLNFLQLAGRGVHLGERSRAHSSGHGARIHVVTYYSGSLCAPRRCVREAPFVRDALATGARSFDGYAPTPRRGLSSFHGSVRALSRIGRTGLFIYESRRLRPIQMQLNSQFRPLRVSGKGLRTRRAALSCVPHLHPCTHRERQCERERNIADVCINAYVPPPDVASHAYA